MRNVLCKLAGGAGAGGGRAEFGGQAARLRTQVEAEQRLGGLLAGLRAAEQGARVRAAGQPAWRRSSTQSAGIGGQVVDWQ